MRDELEQYRAIWNRQPKCEHVKVEEIRHMIRLQSQKATGRIQRNFWYELVGSVIILLLTSYFILSISVHQISIILLFCVVLPISILYVLFTYRFLTVKISDQDLKTSLQYNIRKMGRTNRFYYHSLVFGFPFLYFLALILFVVVNDGPLLAPNVIFVFFFGISISLILPKTAKWFIQKMYGAYLEELKSYLVQLEKTE